jgi:hypothetical protein
MHFYVNNIKLRHPERKKNFSFTSQKMLPIVYKFLYSQKYQLIQAEFCTVRNNYKVLMNAYSIQAFKHTNSTVKFESHLSITGNK